eukprot:48894_1
MSTVSFSGKDFSAFWINCIITHTTITFTYLFIFWLLYYHNYKHNIKPKDRLLISSNTISMIHCFVVIFGAIFAFIHDKLYMIENMIVSENGILAYIWIGCWNSYMFADIIGHTMLYLYYDSKTIKRRYDIIFHHIIAYILVPIMAIPTPIYGWFILVWPPMTEVSSIFLNLQWFGKYNKWKPKTQKCIKIFFYITWFSVRLPSLWIQMVFIIIYWNQIKLWPNHVWITGLSVVASINVLHIIWTVLIIKGLCHARKTESIQNMGDEIDVPISPRNNEHRTNDINSTQTKPSHVHGVSLEFTL